MSPSRERTVGRTGNSLYFVESFWWLCLYWHYFFKLPNQVNRPPPSKASAIIPIITPTIAPLFVEDDTGATVCVAVESGRNAVTTGLVVIVKLVVAVPVVAPVKAAVGVATPLLINSLLPG